jgi:hypothetical protein
MPATRQPADCCACACTDRPATKGALPWVIGIGARGQRPYDAERYSGTCNLARHDTEVSF